MLAHLKNHYISRPVQNHTGLPPLLYENKVIIDFRKIAETFATIFAKQFFVINTCSDLPTFLRKTTRESLSIFCFASDDILKIIKNLDPNKAHGYNMIRVWIVKFCDASLCSPPWLWCDMCLDGETLWCLSFFLNRKSKCSSCT